MEELINNMIDEYESSERGKYLDLIFNIPDGVYVTIDVVAFRPRIMFEMNKYGVKKFSLYGKTYTEDFLLSQIKTNIKVMNKITIAYDIQYGLGDNIYDAGIDYVNCVIKEENKTQYSTFDNCIFIEEPIS